MALKIAIILGFLITTRLCTIAAKQRLDSATSTAGQTSGDHDDSTTTGEVLDSTDTMLKNMETATLDTILNITDQLGLESTLPDLQQQSGLISKDFQEHFKAVLWFGFVPAFTLVGIGGNIFGLCFLRYQRLNQPFYQFLFGLMAVDLLYLIIVLFTIPIPIVERYDQRIPSYIKCYAERNLQLVQSFAYSTCAHIITIMSAERLLSIMLPLKLKAFRYRKYSVILMIILLLLNMILITPAFFILKPKEIVDSETNITTCILVPTEWAMANMSFNQKYSAVILTIARFVPGLATLVTNIIIAIFIARQRFQRTTLFATQTKRHEESARQIKTTVTLMVLSISLLLSLFPSGLATIFKRYFPAIYDVNGIEHYTYLLILDISYLLRVLSAATDFFIYIFTTKASRENIKVMLKMKCGFCYEQHQTNATVQSKDTSDETQY